MGTLLCGRRGRLIVFFLPLAPSGPGCSPQSTPTVGSGTQRSDALTMGGAEYTNEMEIEGVGLAASGVLEVEPSLSSLSPVH